MLLAKQDSPNGNAEIVSHKHQSKTLILLGSKHELYSSFFLSQFCFECHNPKKISHDFVHIISMRNLDLGELNFECLPNCIYLPIERSLTSWASSIVRWHLP